MMIIYDIGLLVICLLYLPYLYLKGKWHDQFLTRVFGLSKGLAGDAPVKRIWIHAVSVGEVNAVFNFVEKISQAFPQFPIVCSTVTKTGYQLALTKFKGKAQVIYAPLDFSWSVKRYIASINPVVYIPTETEIWPNLYRHLDRQKIPIVLINGRISDRSFRNYKMVKGFIKNILSRAKVFCMQSLRDAERLIELGADPKSVKMTGNVKFDDLPEEITSKSEKLNFDPKDLILIAGSTHPNEEEILIDIYKELSMKFLRLGLILCPRHVERAQEVFELVKRKGLNPIRFSKISSNDNLVNKIVVVDTIGHLRSLYSLATVVFIGKTLSVGGGQNMIEPAGFAKPVVVGPMTENFADVMRIFLEEKAVIQVRNADELKVEIERLLENDHWRFEIGARARAVVHRYQGATDRTLEAIRGILKQ